MGVGTALGETLGEMVGNGRLVGPELDDGFEIGAGGVAPVVTPLPVDGKTPEPLVHALKTTASKAPKTNHQRYFTGALSYCVDVTLRRSYGLRTGASVVRANRERNSDGDRFVCAASEERCGSSRSCASKCTI
jgi:hypothetical protein